MLYYPKFSSCSAIIKYMQNVMITIDSSKRDAKTARAKKSQYHLWFLFICDEKIWNQYRLYHYQISSTGSNEKTKSPIELSKL